MELSFDDKIIKRVFVNKNYTEVRSTINQSALINKN